MNPHQRAIFNFHGVGPCMRRIDVGEKAVWMEERQFLEILDAITAHGSGVITVDDGNRSDVEIVMPALRARGLRCKFFVCVGRIGLPGFLDANDIRLLVENQMEVGLHGWAHRSWRTVDERGLEREIDEAKAALERVVGRPVTEAAIPFGAYGRRTLARLRDAGFAAAYTSDGGLADMRRWLRPRRTLASGDGVDAIRQPFLEPLSTRAVRTAKIMLKRWR